MNYIKIAFRNLVRNMSFSWINMIGLATFMTTFLLILMYVSFESSYEKYHAQVNQVCRVNADIREHPGHTCCVGSCCKKLAVRTIKCRFAMKKV